MPARVDIKVAPLDHAHAGRGAEIGQGCEGDPLQNAGLLAESSALYRAGGGKGTINCNTNASDPEAVAMLCDAGLTSLRASLCSARPELYEAYHRPVGYGFADARRSLAIARK